MDQPRAPLSAWFKALLGRGGSRSGAIEPQRPESSLKDDLQAGSTEARAADRQALATLIDEIEHAALAVYAEHGMPRRRGHYGKGPRARRWTFIADDMAPEDRWRLALERPKWRFATLEDLGGQSGQPARVIQAARMLATCTTLRSAVRTRIQPDLAAQLEAAIRLGHDWRGLRQGPPLRSDPPLKFLAIGRGRIPKA
ncbi:MAG: hypothetical protein EBR82_20360 [Caulobacteraceae bacterium]|nr:hypothetical protein [Caulobacteraceae bacterium]